MPLGMNEWIKFDLYKMVKVRNKLDYSKPMYIA
jgi:hypothetical protein